MISQRMMAEMMMMMMMMMMLMNYLQDQAVCGSARSRHPEEAPDSILKHLSRGPGDPATPDHGSKGVPSDGKICLPDDGEPCKLDKRGK